MFNFDSTRRLFKQGTRTMLNLYAIALFSGIVFGLAESSAGAGSGLGVDVPSESLQTDRAKWQLLRCGPVSLQLCGAICGRPLSTDEIDQYFDPGSDENTLAEVCDAAQAVGLRALAIKWRRMLPPPNAPPAVIPIVNAHGRRHFVAMAACRNNFALIVDVPQQPAWVSEDVLRTKLHWNGEALHVAASDAPLANLRSELEFGGRYRAAAPWLTAAAVVCLYFVAHVRHRRRKGKGANRDARSLS